MSKIILILVEGNSDIAALDIPVGLFVDEFCKDVQIKILKPKDNKGDITSAVGQEPKLIAKNISDWWDIPSYLKKNGLVAEDLSEIVQIVDADGIYIPDENVIYVPGDTSYTEKNILCNNRHNIIERNKRKKLNLTKLKTTNSIKINDISIPYRVYYFSCNIDEFTCGNKNLPLNEKTEKADSYSISFESGSDFYDSLSVGNFCAGVTDYKKSWELLKVDLNSLNKGTNITIFLDDLRNKNK